MSSGTMASRRSPHMRRRAMLERVQREVIVEGFAAVAAEKGYAATTIADIARVARVSKSTIYAHFADKEGVYLHLHATVADALWSAMTESIERTADEPDWRARVRDLVAARLETLAGNPAFLAQVVIEPQIASHGARAARRAAGRRMGGLLVGFSEDLAAASPEPAALTADLAIAGLAGQLALVARAAERGPRAVRALEGTLTDLWTRLLTAG